jgi:hypothetical protein
LPSKLSLAIHAVVDFPQRDRQKALTMLSWISDLIRRPSNGAALILLAIVISSAGCGRTVAPVGAPMKSEAIKTTPAAGQSRISRDDVRPKEELAEHCAQLAKAAPGIEELRVNAGTVESRQWTLIVHDSSAPRWALIRDKNAVADGWAPKPGIENLQFEPPLKSALTDGQSRFLAYAPVESDGDDDVQKVMTMNEVFGGELGKFSWRGRKYGYALAPELPCYPTLR